MEESKFPYRIGLKKTTLWIIDITEPGIDKKVAENSNLQSLKDKIAISVNAHKSSLVVVSGHHDCAGNPVSHEEHLAHIKKSVEIISSWNIGAKVIGAWVDENWKITLV